MIVVPLCEAFIGLAYLVVAMGATIVLGPRLVPTFPIFFLAMMLFVVAIGISVLRRARLSWFEVRDAYASRSLARRA